MKISNATIKKLNPCSDRYDNYLSYYKRRSFTINQFMGLKNITHADKLWVCFRLLPKDKIPLVAADIAESVLHIYEERYPSDDRPRKAIEAARSGDKVASAAAKAAYSAAKAAYSAAKAAYAPGTKGRAEQEKLQLNIMLKYLEAS